MRMVEKEKNTCFQQKRFHTDIYFLNALLPGFSYFSVSVLASRSAPHRTQTLFIQWAYNFRFQLHFHSLFRFTFCAESKVPLRQLNAVDFLNFSFSFYARLSFGCSCVRSKEFQITKCFCSWNLLPALMWCFVKTKPFPYTVDPLYDKWFVADEKGWSHKVNMFFAS